MKPADKQVQIPQLLFNQIVKYIFDPAHQTEDQRQQIERGLLDKADRMINHDLYTKYKTAPSEEQREKARLAYCEQVGIPKDYRW